MYALYARQSIEKQDSISVESQLELCKYETRGKEYQEYCDRGYSGKNINRPSFEQMIQDIKQGQIHKVVVYKLDRISRSILDFATMMELFQQYDVEFISSTEKFDTSTPIGRAMLNICIVFAQLERETIQQRVTDAYYARCKKGFYMGGRVPYGYKLEKTVLNGVKTSKYVPIEKEAEHIQLIYELYSEPNFSVGDVMRYMSDNGYVNYRRGNWDRSRLSEMLRNPTYVKADADVYEFFKEQGTIIENPIGEFIGTNGCYLYKGAGNPPDKQYRLANKELVIAPHEGLVDAEIWLKCRRKNLANRTSTQTRKAKNSWLSGKVKCGNCGKAATIRKNHNKNSVVPYFICSAVNQNRSCKGLGFTVRAEPFEKQIYEEIKKKLSEFNSLSGKQVNRNTKEVNELKIELGEKDKEIGLYLDKIQSANDVLMKYINEKVKSIDAEKKEINKRIREIDKKDDSSMIAEVSDHVKRWDELKFEDRQRVADLLIRQIDIANGNVEIHWNC